MQALIKELGIRPVEKSSEIHPTSPRDSRRGRISVSSAKVLFLFTTGSVIPHVTLYLQTERVASRQPAATGARPCACVSTL